MRRSIQVIAAVAIACSSLWPVSAAQDPCVDAEESRTGVLRWAVLGAAFSASSAIATRAVDLERQGPDCVAVHVRCLALAADGSSLQVDVYQGGATYTSSYRGLLVMEQGTARCPSGRDFGGANGALTVSFSG